MTTREVLELADRVPWLLVAAQVALPLLAYLTGLLHGQGNGARAPWKYFYSLLVYAVCIPGMGACVLTAYTVFFQRDNLLDVNPLVYLTPIIAMGVALVLIRRKVSFAEVPGFDRLSGLMVMIACTMGVVLAIDKTRIFIGFFGSIERLLALAVGVFALIKWGAYMLFRTKDQPRQDIPDLKLK